MIHDIILYAIVFLSAFAVSYYSIFTSEKFGTIFFLLYNSKYLIFYSLSYGIIGLLVYLLLKENVLQVTDNNTAIGGEYLTAFGTGISTKAIAEINLFNIKSSNTQFPFGVKTFTQPLDQFFEKKLNDAGFERTGIFLQPYYSKYDGKVADIKLFKNRIATELKRFYPDQKQVGAFITGDSFVKAEETDEILLLVLYEFGETVFKKIFDKIDP